MSNRAEILAAIAAADRFHVEFNSKEKVKDGRGRVDIFGMLLSRDVTVLFRPLKNLLGAFLDDPGRGILVTSKRPLSVQRFTAAHELGHEALGHEASFDQEEVLTRALFMSETGFDPREIQANAFASELLTPPWLIAHHMRHQAWGRDDLTDPRIVYQLSLRMGSSYSATCHALFEASSITSRIRNALLDIAPKAIKADLLGGFEPDTWHGDVWVVTGRDDRMALEGSKNDLVVLKVEEHPSSGYIWQFGDLERAGLVIQTDKRDSAGDSQNIGGIAFRTVIAQAEDELGANGHVSLREMRPWEAQADALQSLDLDVDLSGPVEAGILRNKNVHPMRLH